MRVAGLYAILDLPHPNGLSALELTEALLDGGAGLIQLRAKRATHLERVAILQTIAPLCERAGVPLIVDDDLDAARVGIAGVVGVHLGQGDLDALGSEPGLRIHQLRQAGIVVGLSTHSLDQVEAACALNPGYLGFGPIFPTRSKRDPEPTVGIDRLAQACARAELPVVAIGGIGPEQFAAVMHAGAAAIAVIGALLADTREQTRQRCRALVVRLARTSES